MLRALPWYEGERARITSLEFSPGPTHDRLLCGTAGAARTSSTPARSSARRVRGRDGTRDGDGVPPIPGDIPGDGAAPTIQVLCNAGPGIVSVLGGVAARGRGSAGTTPSRPRPRAPRRRRRVRVERRDSFWDGVWGARLCSVTIPGRIERAELVDAGDTLGQKLLVSGETNGVDSPPSRAHWTVALERGAESLPDAAGKPAFAPTLVRGRFGIPSDDDDVDERSDGVDRSRDLDRDVAPPGRRSSVPGGDPTPSLSVQVGASEDGRGPLIASLRGSIGALALFHPSDERAPSETHRVPPGTTSVRVARRLVFAIGRASEGVRARLSVIARYPVDAASNAHATGTANARNPTGSSAGASPVVLQEIALSAGVGRPLGLMPLRGPDGDGDADGRGVGYPEGCAIFAQGAVLHVRPALDSLEAVFRGLLGVATGPEAESYDRAQVLAGGKDAARRLLRAVDAARSERSASSSSTAARRGYAAADDDSDVSPSAAAAAAAAALSPVDGDAKAATLSAALGSNFAATLGDAARRAVRLGDAARARRLVARAGEPLARFVALCLREWRAADALDQLAEEVRRGFAGRVEPRRFSGGTGARASPGRGRPDASSPGHVVVSSVLRDALGASAWASGTAASAIGSAGTFAEDHGGSCRGRRALDPRGGGGGGGGTRERVRRFEPGPSVRRATRARRARGHTRRSRRGGRHAVPGRAATSGRGTRRRGRGRGGGGGRGRNRGWGFGRRVRGFGGGFASRDARGGIGRRDHPRRRASRASRGLRPTTLGSRRFDRGRDPRVAGVEGDAASPLAAALSPGTGTGTRAGMGAGTSRTSNATRDDWERLRGCYGTRGTWVRARWRRCFPCSTPARRRRWRRGRDRSGAPPAPRKSESPRSSPSPTPRAEKGTGTGKRTGTGTGMRLGTFPSPSRVWTPRTRWRRRSARVFGRGRFAPSGRRRRARVGKIPGRGRSVRRRRRVASRDAKRPRTLRGYESTRRETREGEDRARAGASRTRVATRRGARARRGVGLVADSWLARGSLVTNWRDFSCPSSRVWNARKTGDRPMTWDWTRYSRWSRAIARRRDARRRRRRPGSGRRRAARRRETKHPRRDGVGVAPTKLRFSAGFVLAVSTLRVASMEDARAASSGNASASRLWSRIRGELAAPASLATSTSIRHDASFAHSDDHAAEPTSPGPMGLPVPSPPLSPASPWRAPRSNPTVDSRVFSCGHAMSDARAEATATAFARGMTDAGMPMAGELVAADYALERCAMACPACASRAVHARYGVAARTK